MVNNEKLTLGIASSALFDLADGDRIFREKGAAQYQDYQRDHLDDPLAPGVAFPFIRRLLKLNDIAGVEIDVIVLSRNSPETGLRVMRSVEHHALGITRAVFSTGRSPFRFMAAFNMSLFLSANETDVRAAVAQGLPAGTVLHGRVEEEGDELRVAFDFDGVLADDSSERTYVEGGLEDFQRTEQEKKEKPLGQGPLAGFLAGLNSIQRVEDQLAQEDARYRKRLRVSLVSARSAPAHERAIKSLNAWGLRIDDAFFLGGRDKPAVLNILNPHLFFDDQRGHLDGKKLRTPAVHVPFGVRNLGSLEKADS